jgi:hypothetical protein
MTEPCGALPRKCLFIYLFIYVFGFTGQWSAEPLEHFALAKFALAVPLNLRFMSWGTESSRSGMGRATSGHSENLWLGLLPFLFERVGWQPLSVRYGF